MPGRKSVSVIKKRNASYRVLVLDTSGSMWIEEFMIQMATLAQYLLARKAIFKAYCCDTKLYPFEFDKQKRNQVRMYGMGGSVFNVDHVDEIIKDLKLEENQGVEIFYATDGFVDGLDEVARDERIAFHKILVPNLIAESKIKGENDVLIDNASEGFGKSWK
jgi:hypothetical protein